MAHGRVQRKESEPTVSFRFRQNLFLSLAVSPADRLLLLHLLRAPVASGPAARRGPPPRPQAQRLHFSGGMPRHASVTDAGVGLDADADLVCRISEMAPGIGGLFRRRNNGYLVAGTDDIRTKLELAFETGIYDTIGIDMVAMGVNDILALGAQPMMFLDYYTSRKLLDVDLAEKVIKGILDGCHQANCALLGGDHVVGMHGFYAEGEYDLSSSTVGVEDKNKGDVLMGIPSSGVHTNGLSLARRVLEKSGLSLSDQLPRNDGITTTVGEALMAPSVIYVKQVLEIISKGGVKGVAHITGGGLTDSIPRMFPSGLGAKVFTGSWEVPPVGNIDDAEMRRTFNMGIGMVLVIGRESADRIIEDTHHGSHPAYRVGEVIQGEGLQYV
ncbi:hypothetical protein BS78_04G009100 [Paspalum vaginatum]|nr:hypothetical protein BS78_04G009100 [Paspalum vaginatum]